MNNAAIQPFDTERSPAKCSQASLVLDSSKFANGKHVIHLQFARSIEKTICFEAEESLICFNRNRVSFFNDFHFIPALTLSDWHSETVAMLSRIAHYTIAAIGTTWKSDQTLIFNKKTAKRCSLFDSHNHY